MLDLPTGFSRRAAVKYTGLLMLIMLGCGIVLGLVLGFALGVAKGLHATPPTWLSSKNPLVSVIGNSVTFGLGLRYALRRMNTSWGDLLRFGTASPVIYAAMLVTLSGAVVIDSELGNLLQHFAPTPAAFRRVFAELANLSSYPISGPLMLVVIAPVTEELFFRGFILRRLLAVGTPQQAIWTSALLFMAFHLNPWQFPAALITGLLLGWVYTRTRSLGVCLFAHAIHNGVVLLAPGLPFDIRGFNTPHPDGQVTFQPWWFDLAAIVIFAVGLYLLRRAMPVFIQPTKQEEPPLLVTAASAVTAANQTTSIGE